MSIPNVTGINPTLGSTIGSTAVTIFGKNFTGATNLSFGTTGVSFTIVSDEKITTTSPAGTGSVFVTVTNLNGTSPTTSSNQFTYIASPNITTMNPQMGSSNGGTLVTLTGSNFTGTSTVTFGATSAPTFIVQSDTQIVATSPPGTGTVAISVANPNGSNSISGFIYTTPAIISSISPTSETVSGGNNVIITGTGLTTTTRVFFGNVAANFTINSDTQVTATAPAGTGSLLVDVINAVSISNSLTYNYINQPTITNLNPDSSPQTGNNYVNITGTNLGSATQINFGSLAVLPFYAISDTLLSATVPTSGIFTVNVTVTTPGGTSNALTFNYANQPEI